MRVLPLSPYILGYVRVSCAEGWLTARFKYLANRYMKTMIQETISLIALLYPHVSDQIKITLFASISTFLIVQV